MLLDRERQRGEAKAARPASGSAYATWRESELRSQLETDFNVQAAAGKDVLDFGCGLGALAFLAHEHGAATVLGIDLSRESIGTAQGEAQRRGWKTVRFCAVPEDGPIASGDDSFDLIYCFDVIEHIMHLGLVLEEWDRVLRPGGQAWIWWSPWRHPYGHHLGSLIPLPWVHLLFSEKTLANIAARVYDDPVFIPRHWDLDPKTGAKLPNKWRGQASPWSQLNRLTLRRFLATCREVGLAANVKAYGFCRARKGLAGMASLAAHLPIVGEAFTDHYAIVLTKSAGDER